MRSDDGDGRHEGTLADWKDDRGFGFITPKAGGSRVFVHVSAFPRGRRPDAGCAVTYTVARDERNRPQASSVRYASRARSTSAGGRGVLPALAGATLFLASLGAVVVRGEAPWWLLAWYGGLSAVAIVMYRADKAAARNGTWRTSESTLHAVALAGGWPGALVARPAFRHKTTKQPFRSIFWVTVAVNCLALGWFLSGAFPPLP